MTEDNRLQRIRHLISCYKGGKFDGALAKRDVLAEIKKVVDEGSAQDCICYKNEEGHLVRFCNCPAEKHGEVSSGECDKEIEKAYHKGFYEGSKIGEKKQRCNCYRQFDGMAYTRIPGHLEPANCPVHGGKESNPPTTPDTGEPRCMCMADPKHTKPNPYCPVHGRNVELGIVENGKFEAGEPKRLCNHPGCKKDKCLVEELLTGKHFKQKPSERIKELYDEITQETLDKCVTPGGKERFSQAVDFDHQLRAIERYLDSEWEKR